MIPGVKRPRVYIYYECYLEKPFYTYNPKFLAQNVKNWKSYD